MSPLLCWPLGEAAAHTQLASATSTPTQFISSHAPSSAQYGTMVSKQAARTVSRAKAVFHHHPYHNAIHGFNERWRDTDMILSTCMVGCIEWGQRAYAHSGSTPNAAATSPSASISFQSIRSCCCLGPNGRWLMLLARSQTCSNLGAAAAWAPLQLCPSGTCASTRGSSNRTATASSVVFKAVRSP